MTGRWVMPDHRGLSTEGCRYCGRYGVPDCPPVACLACGSVQCQGNGMSRGTCFVCHNGYLPGWSRPEAAKTCGYRDCDQPAVSYAPRVKQVCAERLNRARINVGGWISLSDYIAARTAHRDSGRGWERFCLLP